MPFDHHEDEDDRQVWICRFADDERGGWGQHRHHQHQLAWVARGSATVEVGDQEWLVPPTQALWIPSGAPHDIRVRAGSELHCLYAWPESCPVDWDEPTVLAITPLLRELLLCIGEAEVEVEVEAAAQVVLFGLLRPVEAAGLELLPVSYTHLTLPTNREV